MSCPDEDAFARFVEGLLPPADAAAIERHVDGCPRCADLAAMFGRVYAPPASDAAGRRWAVRALVALALLHATWAVVVVSASSWLARVYAIYGAVWGPLGAGAAAVAALAVGRGWRGGRGLALAVALLSLPSVALTPLGVFVVWSLRAERAQRAS